ncbi:hypothetical protein FE773_06055 [Caminibacter mediatlanticus TB-2]|uniref:Tetratricopeptide repeat protein n=1 Tax=Caminibacter mediatlanticus TB-2 TaxID=391592 RepID=A0ABX5V8Z7_9BACT|nr:hypothetical protein [Caminibacter mediatlanticus]QCT94757.1 hypothetical protein FE773_06055 [Caminibacter mediatlanticus TB-2]
MDYKDPLFSVIAFFTIVLITIIITITLGKVREHLKQKEINKLLKDFDFIEIEELNIDNNSLNALLMLAKAYEIKGDYEKALKIYFLIQKQNNSSEILKKIAYLYFKAGFLEKARNIIYKVLKVHPRDKEALKLLILIDEKLNNFEEIIDIIEIFEELGEELKDEKANALIKLFNNCNKELCKKYKSFEDIYKEYPFIKKEYVIYLFKTNPKKAYEILDKYEDLDLYFYRSDIPDNDKFCDILAAKKLKKCNIKSPFEIEVLKYLPPNLAELEFEYICENCKNIFPIYSSRCPKCNSLFKLKLLTKIAPKTKNIDIENISI